MDSGNASPSLLSTLRNNIHQEQPDTTVDTQAFGGSTDNMANQSMPYGASSNMRMDSHATMDIDSWIYETRPQSDLAMSYISGGLPPSIGDVRQIVVSQPSGGYQIYSDGQPPSVNDVGKREPSQSEASCTRYEGHDEHEVQQVISELNERVYKRGTVGRSRDITAKQDPVSRVGSKVSEMLHKVHKRKMGVDILGSIHSVRNRKEIESIIKHFYEK